MMSGIGLRKIIEECQRCTNRLNQVQVDRPGITDFCRSYIEGMKQSGVASFTVDDVFEAGRRAGMSKITRNGIGTALGRQVEMGALWVQKMAGTSKRGRPVNRYAITGLMPPSASAEQS